MLQFKRSCMSLLCFKKAQPYSIIFQLELQSEKESPPLDLMVLKYFTMIKSIYFFICQELITGHCLLLSREPPVQRDIKYENIRILTFRNHTSFIDLFDTQMPFQISLHIMILTQAKKGNIEMQHFLSELTKLPSCSILFRIHFLSADAILSQIIKKFLSFE